MALHGREVSKGERFEFGENWRRFLAHLSEERIREAEDSLKTMLEQSSLAGLSFVDVGSGSGLFSLAARRLGAHVISFDYDPASVACTRELRRRFFDDDSEWVVREGSVLDISFLDSLGTFDIVYSWGVLHHTGAMWRALENVARLVAPSGRMFLAIYNDQGRGTRMWKGVKRAYNRLPRALKWLVVYPAFLRLWGPRTVIDIVRGRPFATWRQYGRDRGMSPWHDVIDWVGGYPFEVAKPEQILDFYRARHFTMERMTTCAGGHGCNEYVMGRVGGGAVAS